MKRATTKVERLIRLNEFREECADNRLRVAVTEQAQATEKHASAARDVDRIGAWKSGQQGGRIDLMVYGAALELEQIAMARAEKLRIDLQEHERSTQQARDALVDASRATRVADKRGMRERRIAMEAYEKRLFDQVADVWLANREKPRD